MPSQEVMNVLYKLEKRWWNTEAQLDAILAELDEARKPKKAAPEPKTEPKPKKSKKKESASVKSSE